MAGEDGNVTETDRNDLEVPLISEHSSTNSYQNQEIALDHGETDHNSQSENGNETHSHQSVNVLIGRVLLFSVAFLYGTLNVSLRFVYELDGPPSASALSTSRGWLAVLCFLPLILGHGKGLRTQPGELGNNDGDLSQSDSRTSATLHTRNEEVFQFWRVASELAAWNFGAQGLLTLGLLSVESARASFLTQTR